MRGIILIILCLVSLHVQAQKTNLRVGIDLGVKHYDIVEELVNANKYEGTVFSLLNPTFYRISENKISFLRLSYSNLSLESEVANSDFSADLIDVNISYNYLWNIHQWNKLSFYLGGNVNTHLKVYSQNFRGKEQLEAFESSLINLRLSSAIKLNVNNWELYLNPEVGLLNFWTKAIPIGTSINDYRYQTDLLNNFAEYQITFLATYKLSENWEFKPEYSFSYYNYNFKETLRSSILNQRWFIGFYYLL